MDSPALTSRLRGSWFIPLLAVVQDDLRQTVRHWAFLVWALLAIGLPAFWVASLPPAPQLPPTLATKNTQHMTRKPTEEDSSSAAGRVPAAPRSLHRVEKPNPDGNYRSFGQEQDGQGEPTRPPAPNAGTGDEAAQIPSARGMPSDPNRITASSLGGKLLGMHLLVWSGLAIALGACAVSGEAPIAGDCVLCWGVSRYQYMLGKGVARVVGMTILFVGLTAPTMVFFAGRVFNDLTMSGVVHTLLGCVGLLSGVVLIGVALGAWFKNSMYAAAGAIFLLVALGGAGSLMGPPEYSAVLLAEHFPNLLRGEAAGPGASLIWVSSIAAAVLGVGSTLRFSTTDH